MADLIVADGQYESITASQTLVAVEGKLYYRKNTSAGVVIVTYGTDTMSLKTGDVGIFLYDGTLWTNLTPRVEGGDAILDSLTVTGATTISSSGITSSSSSIDLLKNTVINGGVGVSTSGLLVIRQSGDGVDNGISITSSNADSHRIWKDSNGTLGLSRSNKAGLFITTSGRTMIGTNPTDNGTDLLQVGGATVVNGLLTVNRAGSAFIDTVLNVGATGNGGNDRGSRILVGVPGDSSVEEGATIDVYTLGYTTNTQTTKMVLQTATNGILEPVMGLSGSEINLYKDTTITGSLSKSSGSFRIPHPLKPETHELVHSFVEAPQADNIYRGKVGLVDGKARVNIDTVAGMSEGTFVALNREVQVFTTNESGWNMVRGSVEGNILTIEAQTECTDSISWMVIGERHDEHMYDTEWTDEQGKVIVEPEIKTKEEENI